LCLLRNFGIFTTVNYEASDMRRREKKSWRDQLDSGQRKAATAGTTERNDGFT
jgi:hypothetical protein